MLWLHDLWFHSVASENQLIIWLETGWGQFWAGFMLIYNNYIYFSDLLCYICILIFV